MKMGQFRTNEITLLGSQVVGEVLHLPDLANWYFGASIAPKLVSWFTAEAEWFPPPYWMSSIDDNMGGCGRTVDADYWRFD
jgi:hypothetical protein